jgi:sugar phosphate isomerase/epimerase
MTLIGTQLWTVRDRQDDVGALFEELAAVGVEAVEPFGLGNPDTDVATRIARARELRRAADDAGLAIVSTHTRLPTVENAAILVEEMQELGVSLAISSAPEHMIGFQRDMLQSDDRIRRYAQTLNALAEAVESDGLRIGYHNHSWEWHQLEDGTLAYDLLWENLDPRIVTELDVMWATFAGQDAVSIAERLKDRVRLLHAGDASPITNTDYQLPAGAGDSPITAVLEVAGPLDAVFVEATTPPPGSTQIDLIRQSVEWLRTALADRRPSMSSANGG